MQFTGGATFEIANTGVDEEAVAATYRLEISPVDSIELEPFDRFGLPADNPES